MLKKEIENSGTIEELKKYENYLEVRRDFLEELLDDVFDDERLLIEEELNEISKSLESIKIRRNQINDMI